VRRETMDTQKAIAQATQTLLRSKAFRTFGGYTLDIEKEDAKTLVCKTWGYDYERIDIPQTQADICRMNYQAQFTRGESLSELRFRYAQEILHNESAI
jgi:hypothetical protein